MKIKAATNSHKHPRVLLFIECNEFHKKREIWILYIHACCIFIKYDVTFSFLWKRGGVGKKQLLENARQPWNCLAWEIEILRWEGGGEPHPFVAVWGLRGYGQHYQYWSKFLILCRWWRLVVAFVQKASNRQMYRLFWTVPSGSLSTFKGFFLKKFIIIVVSVLFSSKTLK